MVNLRDKRVGVIGTGASAVQVVSHMAESSKELVAFQRTPPLMKRHENHVTDGALWESNSGLRGPD